MKSCVNGARGQSSYIGASIKCSFKQKALQTLKKRTWIPLISNLCCRGSPLFSLRSFCGNLRAFCEFRPLAQEDFSVSSNTLKSACFIKKHDETPTNAHFLRSPEKSATIEGSGIADHFSASTICEYESIDESSESVPDSCILHTRTARCPKQ